MRRIATLYPPVGSHAGQRQDQWVRQRGVTELMQRPAGLVDEQFGGSAVGQARAAGERADVAAGGRPGRARAEAGQEHRTGAAAGDQAWQQPRTARAEEQPVDAAALRARPCALGRDVEILDVEAQNLVGAGGGLVEQPPQRAFAQVGVAALPQPLEARERDAAGVSCSRRGAAARRRRRSRGSGCACSSARTI